jgi:demethylmenaquinone methyltransferase/2-methoxy-6-polyprenyl-1,4-benzoquinol methylase
VREQNSLLEEQLHYYRARAAEYDDWFLRRGQFDRGVEENAKWSRELRALDMALRETKPAGDVLELACGTGWWTKRLLSGAIRLLAVDAAPEMLRLNRQRVRDPRVEYVQADLFDWQPTDRFDFVFFAFWLSHVPTDRFEAFWSMVADALKPSGRVFFADNKRVPGASASTDDANGQVRRLNDGREFRIVKVYYEPEELTGSLTRLGWRCQVRTTEKFFIFGVADRTGG